MSFRQIFDREPQYEASAPGRINLIGEHIDYNGGYVLPMVLPQKTRAQVSLRDDAKVRVSSAFDSNQVTLFQLGEKFKTGRWVDYIQGITQTLELSQGFDLYVESDVPVGSGLSSSAALEISVLRALRFCFNLKLSDVDLARIGQHVENHFVGANVGIMDQMICSLGQEKRPLLINTQTLAYEDIPFPDSLELIVINSGIVHSNAHGDYNKRRQECIEASKLLGVDHLCQAPFSSVTHLPQPYKNRARHAVFENRRVLEFVEILKNGLAPKHLGALLNESHNSLSKDFDVSTPEMDTLVMLLQSHPKILGARMIGGGFGGSVLALCFKGDAEKAALETVSSFNQVETQEARVILPTLSEKRST